MSDWEPLRAELEKILTSHPRTRYAKVLLGMNRGLTDTEMSEEASAVGEPCKPDSIAAVRKTVQLTLNDRLVAAPSDAEGQAGLYRELLNYPRTPNLHQHVMTRLTQLQRLDPAVKMTPLGPVHLGSNDVPRPEKPEPICPNCRTIHKGECW